MFEKQSGNFIFYLKKNKRIYDLSIAYSRYEKQVEKRWKNGKVSKSEGSVAQNLDTILIFIYCGNTQQIRNPNSVLYTANHSPSPSEWRTIEPFRANAAAHWGSLRFSMAKPLVEGPGPPTAGSASGFWISIIAAIASSTSWQVVAPTPKQHSLKRVMSLKQVK